MLRFRNNFKEITTMHDSQLLLKQLDYLNVIVMLFAIEVVSTLENFRDPDGNQTRNILNTSLHDSNN